MNFENGGFMDKLLLTQLLVISFIFVFVAAISIITIFRIYFHQKNSEKAEKKSKIYEVKRGK